MDYFWLGADANTRVVKILKNAGIATPEEAVESIVRLARGEFRGFGRSSYNRVIRALTRTGHLGPIIPAWQPESLKYVRPERELGTTVYLLESEIKAMIEHAGPALKEKLAIARTKLR